MRGGWFLFQLKTSKDQTVFWAKNCRVSCFGGGLRGFSIWANLDTSRGPDWMSGTSAYLFFKEGVLESVKFQVLLNQTIAAGSVAQFVALCQDAFGAPNGGTACWFDDDALIFCAQNNNNSLFVWKTKRHASEYGPVA